MTFLNGLLALGAAAFAIPLLIHLLFRTRYVTVPWGAMHLLQSSSSINTRRIQWQQLLLLLLRCMLPILLALTMARPLVRSWQSGRERSPMGVAILIDDSLSMFAKVPANDGEPNEGTKRDGASTRFGNACRAAVQILNALPEGSDAVVIMAGQRPVKLEGRFPRDFVVQLEQLADRKVAAGKLDLDGAFGLATPWLTAIPHAKRQLIVLTDCEKSEWSELDKNAHLHLAEQIKVLDSATKIAIINVASKVLTKIENGFVDSIVVTPSLVVSGADTVIATTLGTHRWQNTKDLLENDATRESVQVAIFVNDFEIGRHEVTLTGGKSQVMRTRWSPKASGEYVVRAQILGGDVLEADNSLSVAAVVQEPIPLLLVDGDQRSEPMQSETDFLRLALSPFSILQAEKGDVFVTKTIPPTQLTAKGLEKYRVACLCNVADLTSEQQIGLRDFVDKGNGLVFFLGDRVQVDKYRLWASISNGGLRCLALAIREALADSALGARIQMQGSNFRPIRQLSPASIDSLAKAQFFFRMPMTLEPDLLSNNANSSVVMEFEDGQPWMIETEVGKGRCLWINTACDDGDSNLPTKSMFVPLIQKLAAYAASAHIAESSIEPGSEWTRNVQSHFVSSSSTQSRQFLIRKPDGKSETLNVGPDGEFRFDQTRLVGVYLAEPIVSTGELSAAAVHQKPSNQLVLGVQHAFAKQESELVPLSTDGLAALEKTLDARVLTNADELIADVHANWVGREVWTWVWMLLMICFLAEIAWVHAIASQRSIPKSNLNRKAGERVLT
jgi:hypothetical protein